MANDPTASEIQELQRKLEASPDSLVFVSLADAYRRQGNLKQALEVCRKGLERNPTAAGGRVVLGRVLKEQGKGDEAEAQFRKALDQDPDNLMARSQLGALLLESGRHQAAIDEFQKVLTLNPDDEAVQQLLKEAIEKAAGEAPKPKAPPAAAVKETRSKAKEPTATLTLAELYAKQGHYDKAVEVFQELLAADPQNLLLRQKLAEAVEKQGASEGAAPRGAAAKLKKDDFVRPPDHKEDSLEDMPAPRPAEASGKGSRGGGSHKFTRDEILQVMMGGASRDDAVTEVPSSKAAPKQAVEGGGGFPAPGGTDAGSLKNLQPVLENLSGTEGILGCALLGPDRKPAVTVGRLGSDPGKVAALASAIFGSTEKSVVRLAQGALQQVLVTAEKGQIFLVSLPQGVLVVLANDQINIGRLRLALDTAVKKITKG